MMKATEPPRRNSKHRCASSLLIIGGSTVERDDHGRVVTKAPIADYLHQISSRFDSCTWVASQHEGRLGLAGVLDEQRVQLITLRAGGPLALLRAYALVLRACMKRPHVLLYLPTAALFVPIMPLIRLWAERVAVYLGADYRSYRSQAPGSIARLRTGLFRASHELTMRFGDVVVARGKHLASVARGFNSNVVETFPIGHLDTNGRSDGLRDAPTGPPTILYLGKLLQSKGVGDLLEAFAALLTRCRNEIHLDIVGDGPDREDLKDCAQRLGIGGVEFHGWVDDPEELRQFFRRAWVLVAPSTYPEGVPRVIDEALSHGVPAVATPVGGIQGEFADDEVMLVGTGQVDALADAIWSILFDQSTRKRYLRGATRRGRRWVDEAPAAQQHADLLLSGETRGRGD